MSASSVIRLGANQVIQTSTFTEVIWGLIHYQDLIVWRASAPTRITIPVGYTHALLTADVSWDTNTTNDRFHTFLKNGAAFDGGPAQFYAGSQQERTRCFMSSFVEVTAGDYFEVQVWQNSGTDREIVTGNTPNFAIELFD